MQTWQGRGRRGRETDDEAAHNSKRREEVGRWNKENARHRPAMIETEITGQETWETSRLMADYRATFHTWNRENTANLQPSGMTKSTKKRCKDTREGGIAWQKLAKKEWKWQEWRDQIAKCIGKFELFEWKTDHLRQVGDGCCLLAIGEQFQVVGGFGAIDFLLAVKQTKERWAGHVAIRGHLQANRGNIEQANGQ